MDEINGIGIAENRQFYYDFTQRDYAEAFPDKKYPTNVDEEKLREKFFAKRLQGEAPIKFLEVSQLKDAIKALYNFRARLGLETELIDDFRILSWEEPPEDSL